MDLLKLFLIAFAAIGAFLLAICLWIFGVGYLADRFGILAGFLSAVAGIAFFSAIYISWAEFR